MYRHQRRLSALADNQPGLCACSNHPVEQPSSEPGVRAFIDHRRALTGDGLVPEQVTHATAGLQWQVLEVLEHWQHPDGMRARGPVVREAWKMRVTGPLPGRPQQNGEFVMTARMYAHVGGWWITPA